VLEEAGVAVVSFRTLTTAAPPDDLCHIPDAVNRAS